MSVYRKGNKPNWNGTPYEYITEKKEIDCTYFNFSTQSCEKYGKRCNYYIANRCKDNTVPRTNIKIYINIVKEVEDPKKVLTTLSALITQILLFAETSNVEVSSESLFPSLYHSYACSPSI